MESMMERELKKGYTCDGCRQEHKFPVYVFSHWDEELVHTCDCGQKNAIHRGHTWMIEKARPR